ncbi:WXG100 family type VII secretion target [Ruania rhizosphaerae]|uniref:WXG100 family type VII secretion target n=1 Tax=Ruania rhizosphaerae TaxID=1840413 RepID=UPI00135960B9|nr:WXG100 family type VII secretion target [Ruania rhizosphaerae]
MAQFQVDSAEVARAGASARVSAAAIRTEVTNMMRHLTSLQSSWHGSAAASFSALITDWRATQQQVEASLEQISLALDTGAREYEAAETANTRLFAR